MNDAFDPRSVALPVGHFIGGQLVCADDGPFLDVARPADGAPLGRIPDADAAVVDHAVTDAARAWRTSGWASRPPRERARAMLRWADLMEAHRGELARLETVCSTRPIRETLAWDVPFTAEAIRFFAECADKYGGTVFSTPTDVLGLLVAEPIGVVGAIAPWNFPLSMTSWKCGPALAAGNAVVLKMSELTPYSALRVAQLAVDAGIPPGILNVVSGAGPVSGAALVRHPQIGKISFTGSTATGADVMANAARYGLKPVTLELGGKSPQVVFDDAYSIGDVARHIIRGFTANGGQSCVAGSRLIVQRRVADRLLDALVTGLAAIEPRMPWDEAAEYSPIISARQIDRIQRLVSGAVSAGAQLLTGGTSFADTGYERFFQPTILTGIPPNDAILEQEVFGPVLTVEVFDEEEEGLTLAGHPTYGLAAGVYTRDMGKALRAMRTIEAGTVWINRYGRTNDFIVPTGGYRQSGIGKDLGRQAFEANQRYKSVVAAIAT